MYPHFDELKSGLATAKRIVAKVNERLRRAKNTIAVEKLSASIQDWKRYDLASFGQLVLDDYFVVTTRITGHERDHKHHMFLFERAIVCCKEADSIHYPDDVSHSRQNSQESSLVDAPQSRSTSVLKGVIWMNHLTRTVPCSLGARIFIICHTHTTLSRPPYVYSFFSSDPQTAWS
jgi:cell division control protein 24